MAIAFCNQRPFVCSTIIGATTMEQLTTDIGATDVSLSDEALEDIQQVYRRYPIPF
jgi:aryl-alcohol dehydrogenase-like predicted oxidoreductase